MDIIRGKLPGALKVVVYGPEGIGKSTFASQFPNPLFIDTEGSTRHMDVARTPKPTSWPMLLGLVGEVIRDPSLCRTLVVDTMDWAELMCTQYVCDKYQKKSIEEFGYGKGYTYLSEEFGRLLNLLSEVVERGVHAVVTAHAKMRKFEQPDELGAYDRWEMKLSAKNAPLVKEWADMVLFASYKSLHAIVHIDAADYNEYRSRVEYLYAVCRRNGLELDQQNRNPSRLSRMPGVMRGGKKQYLIDVNLGKANFAEWKEWIESVTDDLPDPESMSEVWDHLPDLAPPLIEGVLRQGHKMLLAGPSKAGKSFGLIELVIALAEGRDWLGFSCAQGRVLYVNLELDRASCLHRFRDVYDKLGWPPRHLSNIDIWNLRGKAIPMDKLAPKLIRRALKKEYIAVVIDPIYKIITGDENSADQMAAFCNQFDLVCTELGCAVIYCHHHSKGNQGGKRSMDRASGSGVFARDPDALLDLIELDISDDLRKQLENNAVCKVCGAALEAAGRSDDVSQDTLCSQREALDACKRLLYGTAYNALLNAVADTRREVQARTAWRIEGTLREFPRFPPVNLWFEFPLHRPDHSGLLADIRPGEDAPAWKQGRDKKPVDKRQERLSALETAYVAIFTPPKSMISATVPSWMKRRFWRAAKRQSRRCASRPRRSMRSSASCPAATSRRLLSVSGSTRMRISSFSTSRPVVSTSAQRSRFTTS